ncbi:MAG: guanitoxin biosynthesis L-enduracididine beta-hydroxylase GntD [Oscillatoria sp. PMC 1068.18]|nr:guanitoxin biosynthesis L-enduracididine beta-hydroxylase GntD [Oscillatoria sp. PMC 1076.18]MEC4988642.1 guanitoxin biosynthesis L-enduracididine beta-hydroxylase GntD [Oscillatoria sp. PMC 1068.18]
MLRQLTLNQNDLGEIQQLLELLVEKFTTPEDPQFIHNASIYAHDLPLSIRQFFNDCRLNEADDEVIYLISGYPIDDQKIGLTPSNRSEKKDTPRTLEEQLLLALCGSLLGDLFGWATQQAGWIVHDILPVKGEDFEQMGSSSQVELSWHTEDSFHSYRCDYLGMMCLRNPNQGATSLASSQAVLKLDKKEIQILCEPRFIFRSDDSHLAENQPTYLEQLERAQTDGSLEAAYQRVNKMNTRPTPRPAFFGDSQQPYLCIDSIYLKGIDEEADRAAQALIKAVNDELTDLVLNPGDICFIDNYRAVHGRRPFIPTYDGNDRWLKRINITRDLRKSRDRRILGRKSRIIF